MEKAALSISKVVLKEALSYARSAIAEEVALQLGLQRDQAFIRHEFEMMEAFLMTAHEEPDKRKVVKVWVKQVREVSYDVEDYLQDFAIRLGRQPWWRKRLRWFLDRRHVAKKMKDLRRKVEDVGERNQRYRLIMGPNPAPAPARAALQSSDAGATALGGIEEAKEGKQEAHLSDPIRRDDQDLQGYTDEPLSQDEAIKQIIRDTGDQQLKVISIYGMGGVGTTLAEGVYLNQEFRANFNKHAFVKVPSDAKDLISLVTKKVKMTEEIEQEDPTSFLIVLDGLCTVDHWEAIWQELPKGTTIIVTTEKLDIAKRCSEKGKGYKHLSEGNAWKLFTEKGSQGSRSDDTTTTGSNNTMGGQGNAYSEPLFQGRDKDANKVDELISATDGKKIKVIAICGMGGVGKTSLAKHVYQKFNNATFDKRAFVTVNNHPFNANDLIYQLTMELKKDDVPEKKEEGVIVKKQLKKDEKPLDSLVEGKDEKPLDSLVEGKNCLVVLDDLSTSESEARDAMKQLIEKTTKARRFIVIVTTREEKIAKRCSEKGGHMLKLQGLAKTDAWKLFTDKVFNEKMEQKELEQKYGKKLADEAALIMDMCDGLPLAICVIGGFLAEQDNCTDWLVWEKLNTHIRDELDTNPGLKGIKMVLSKSIDGLPSNQLKSCFLYISIFPKDHHISRRRLVRRWIAEGYSSEGHSKSQEEMADGYFTELIKRSMLQASESKKSIRSRKVIDSCQVHDTMREISILRSTEENLVLRLETGCSSSSMQGKPRHLVVSDWNGGQSQFERIVDPSGIRSVTVFGQWHAFILSKKMRFLRVLDLEDTSGLVQHHLEHIGEFLHMKYLSLRGCRGICYLPDSIGNLKQLQTLDITDTSIIKLPTTVVKLRKLQYLRAWAKYKQESYDDLSESCAACCAPEIMGDVLQSPGNYFRSDVCDFCCCLMFPAYARKLAAPGVAVPRGVRRLKALHTLGAVNIAADKHILKEDIGRLTRLRKLAVTNVNKKNFQDLCKALDCLVNLESLFVRREYQNSEDFVKEPLYEPPKSLLSLKLVGSNLFGLVKWEAQDNKEMNLVKLKLESTNISEPEATMALLGNLPELRILRLLRGSFRGADLTLEFPAEAFPKLTVLEVDRIQGLKEVKFQKKSAPKLELVQYRGLTNTKPPFSGIELLRKSQGIFAVQKRETA